MRAEDFITKAASVGRLALDGDAQQPDDASWAQLEEERNKDDIINEINWKRVIQLTLALAPTAGRDLRVYNLLCIAAFRLYGYEALGTALGSYADLITKGWDLCKPLRKRADHLTVLSDELTQWAKRQPLAASAGPQSAAALQEQKKLLAALDLCGASLGRFAKESLQRGGPGFSELSRHIAALQESLAASESATAAQGDTAAVAEAKQKPAVVNISPLPRPAASPPAADGVRSEPAPPKPVQPAQPIQTVIKEVAAPLAPTAAVGTPPPSPERDKKEPAAVPMGQDRQKLLRDAQTNTIEVCRQLLALDVRDPVPYWLLRAAVWGGWVQPATSGKDGRRLPFQPPPSALEQRLTMMLEGGRLEELIVECEAQLTGFPVWLELQRLVAVALERLGAVAARLVVLGQTRALLASNPELPTLQFAGGKQLIADPAMPWLAGTGTAGATGVTGVVGKFSPTVMTESARVPATSLPTDLRSALRVLNEARARAASVRERFAIGLQMVEVCLAHKRHDLARPLLAQLEQAAKHHDLEVWEPALAVAVLRSQVIVTMAAKDPASTDIWHHLCQLSPDEADALNAGPLRGT